METIHLTGLKPPISRIILGTGNPAVFTPDHYQSAARLLDAFLEVGGNCLDTAHVYGQGASERTLGRWFQERRNRDRVVVVTKGCHPRLEDFQPRLTPAALRQDLAESLARLQTDYVDLYLLHRDDETVPVGAIIEALNELQAAGQIRAFGVSNWRVERIAAANAYAGQHGLHNFSASSPSFSLARVQQFLFPGCQFASEADRAWHAATQFPLLAWSAGASGFLSGRFTPEDRSREHLVKTYYSADNFERLRRATEVGRRHGVGPYPIGLAYILGQPFPTAAITGPSSVSHLQDTCRALDIRLTTDELSYLEARELSPPE